MLKSHYARQALQSPIWWGPGPTPPPGGTPARPATAAAAWDTPLPEGKQPTSYDMQRMQLQRQQHRPFTHIWHSRHSHMCVCDLSMWRDWLQSRSELQFKPLNTRGLAATYDVYVTDHACNCAYNVQVRYIWHSWHSPMCGCDLSMWHA